MNNKYHSLTKDRLCCTKLFLRLMPQYNFQMNNPAPKIYRTTNWSLYNRDFINRGEYCRWSSQC